MLDKKRERRTEHKDGIETIRLYALAAPSSPLDRHSDVVSSVFR